MVRPTQQPPQTKVAEKPAFRRNSPWPFLFTFFYIALLIVPWVFTCLLNKGKFHLKRPKTNYGYHNLTLRAQPRDIEFNTNIVHAIDVLSYIAAVTAMPVIYDLLSRAAAVYSQRTSLSKPLSAKQLFSLADGGFIRHLRSPSRKGTWLYLLGTGLVVLSIIQLPIRAIFVRQETIYVPQGAISETRGWDWHNSVAGYEYLSTPDHAVGQLVGTDPAPAILAATPKDMVVARTRGTLKSLASDEVLFNAWRDGPEEGSWEKRVFASSVPKNSVTGIWRQLATRINSTCHCEPSEFPSQCDDGGLNYKSDNLTIEFCVGGLFQKSPWKLEQYLREDITEEFYVRLSANKSRISNSLFCSEEIYRCTGNSSLGYFELGNQFNNGIYGPLVSAPYRTLDTAVQAGFHADTENSFPLRSYAIPKTSDFMPGPLGLSLLALFGPGSFPKAAESIRTADDVASRTLCRTLPFHFEKYRDKLIQVDSIYQDGDIHPNVCSDFKWTRDPETDKPTGGLEWYMEPAWQDEYLLDFVGTLCLGRSSYTFYSPSLSFGGENASTWLSMAMHYANQGWLDIASSNRLEGPEYLVLYPTCIWNVPGLEYNKPSVSTAGVVVVSVLLGFQVLGLLFLLGYIYSTPTWTSTLDSLAIARIAYQLPDEDQDLLKTIGLRRARSGELKKLGAGVEEEANSSLLPTRDNVKEAKVSELTV
ncbi:hypothetical protein B0T09DRAFT_268396 [Sordaria sp. MPI-SDFR-AT-0083]|nr:hypothetical protein B0T09DRAFT_268396 [Sordaria sp. MPI-SDFR-AT-0083]